jgi:ABC-type polysaccharide/polyol phosphate export permease
MIQQYYEDFRWVFVDKSDPAKFWAKLLKTWFAQMVIISVLFVGILIMMKRKDKAA